MTPTRHGKYGTTEIPEDLTRVQEPYPFPPSVIFFFLFTSLTLSVSRPFPSRVYPWINPYGP